MRRSVMAAGLTVIAVVMLISGCGSEKADSRTPPDSPAVQALHQALAAREAGHYASALQATEPLVLREETVGYASDMDSLVDAMETACAQAGSTGMMDMMGDQMMSMHQTMDDMRGAVHAHHQRMGELATLDEMRAECETHHQSMMTMMDSMGGMGGMGDHMPGGDLPPDDPHAGHHR